MAPRVSVFIATSLDGYIARANGDSDGLARAASLHVDGAGGRTA
jgi:riboflavin biosynthesis pyrimidine reductase